MQHYLLDGEPVDAENLEALEALINTRLPSIQERAHKAKRPSITSVNIAVIQHYDIWPIEGTKVLPPK